MRAYYYLLQIAFILTQLLERGSLLRQLTADLGKRLDQAFGSLANIAQRLLMPARVAPLALYEKLRERNPAPFAGYFDMGEHLIVSASPERSMICVSTMRSPA